VPEQSVLKLDIGERIRLGAAQSRAPLEGFLADIRCKFL
jgi:hypothetical protein